MFVTLISGDKHKLERQGLLNSVLSSMHIVRDLVVEVFGGNKDGFYLTDVFNSVCNCMYAISSYSIAFECRYGYMPEVSSFDDDVALLTYGDDIVAETSENADFYNRNTLCEIYTLLGMLMQPGDKRIGEASDYDHIDDVTFLKSHFVECQDVMLAPMPPYVVYKQINWHKKTVRDEPRIYIDILQGVLRDSAHIGSEFYSDICGKLRASIKGTMYEDQVKFPTWISQLNDVRALQDEVREGETLY